MNHLFAELKKPYVQEKFNPEPPPNFSEMTEDERRTWTKECQKVQMEETTFNENILTNVLCSVRSKSHHKIWGTIQEGITKKNKRDVGVP